MRPVARSLLALALALPALAVAGGSGDPRPDGTFPAGQVLTRLAQPAVTLEAVNAFKWNDIVGIRVRAGGAVRVFPAWRSISNPTFWPTLQAADLTGDGKPEVLAQLMVGEGTGYAVFDARVLALPDATTAGLRELKVAEPLNAIRARVTFAPGAVTLGGVRHTLDLPEGVPTVSARIGDQLHWSVRSGRLVAEAVVQQEWAFSGTLLLIYRVQDGAFVPDRVEYDASIQD
ncbi:hypothetical protein E7T06_06215 [Deinococcus sp. Arct2-2]|uniref:hypothetical protein n=1 Tax=Deinococcus sp. Arct2-2 TaxID=2568653 RepID=UPI0010A56A0A|nr:hypothetical protein [Deinococcus sp. Arct2-2]THF70726.1 hypothetical protein E7T06_06215 [Deinococcus sp. Arct2-2]